MDGECEIGLLQKIRIILNKTYLYKNAFMTTKLTLSIDEEKAKKIKRYTKAKGISVSKFFEQQIDSVTTPKIKKNLNIDLLKGVFGKVPEDFDWKKEKSERLIKKYVK
jgi:pyridoxine 5'-phosphate synthase PdxJ